jgi:CBS domain-containing protein
MVPLSHTPDEFTHGTLGFAKWYNIFIFFIIQERCPMKVKNCMKTRVIRCGEELSIREAAALMVRNHIGTLPVTDPENHLVGVCNLLDLVIRVMPDFFHMVENVDFISDFGAIENKRVDQALLEIPIRDVMGEPISIEEDDGLVRAIALLQEHNLTDLPVVDGENHLVGIASYVDIGVRLLSSWTNLSE